MTLFEQHLFNIGYLPHSEIYNKKGKSFDFVPITLKEASFFSSTSGGRLHNVWIKGDSFVFFGLNEVGKPPTLISPRPKNIHTDDEMNRLIKRHSPNELLNTILNGRNIDV